MNARKFSAISFFVLNYVTPQGNFTKNPFFAAAGADIAIEQWAVRTFIRVDTVTRGGIANHRLRRAPWLNLGNDAGKTAFNNLPSSPRNNFSRDHRLRFYISGCMWGCSCRNRAASL